MAAGTRSSSSTWSSLRSISSRRRRIRERLLSEVKNSPKNEAPAGGGRGGALGWGLRVGRADRSRPLHSAAVGQVCWFFASPTSPSGRYRLGRSDPVHGLVYLRQIFVRRSHGRTFLRRS